MRYIAQALLLLILSTVMSTSLLAETPQEVLKRFVGDWKTKVTAQPLTGQPIQYESKSVRTMSARGTVVRMEELRPEGFPEVHTLMTYDRTNDNYPIVTLEGAKVTSLVGTWDAETTTMRMVGSSAQGTINWEHRFVGSNQANIAGGIFDASGKAVVKITVEENRSDGHTASKKQIQNGLLTAQHVVDSMDKNNDGKISEEEASKELKPYFAANDRNADGFIDVSEAQVIADYANQTQQPPATSEMKKSTPDNGRVTAQQIVTSIDKDGDQAIGVNESSEELRLYFDHYDKNRDKVIDLREAQSIADYVNQQIEE